MYIIHRIDSGQGLRVYAVGIHALPVPARRFPACMSALPRRSATAPKCGMLTLCAQGVNEVCSGVAPADVAPTHRAISRLR